MSGSNKLRVMYDFRIFSADVWRAWLWRKRWKSTGSRLNPPPSKTKVYLLVECDVEDESIVNGCDAMSRAARTLNDVIFMTPDIRGNDRSESGKIQFDIFGKVAIGHPSIIMNEVIEILEDGEGVHLVGV